MKLKKINDVLQLIVFQMSFNFKFLSVYKFMHLAYISWAPFQLFPPSPVKESDKGFLALSRNENETNMHELTV